MSDGWSPTDTSDIDTACGTLYVRVLWTQDHKIKRIFANLGKGGGCPASFLDGFSYLAKLAIRAGVEPKEVIKGLKGISCPQHKDACWSCADAFGKALEKILVKEDGK